MAKDDDVMVQLATRIPKTVHRAVRLHCVQADETMMQFVIDALNAKLTRDRGRRRARPA
jgi:hypothetical protein